MFSIFANEVLQEVHIMDACISLTLVVRSSHKLACVTSCDPRCKMQCQVVHRHNSSVTTSSGMFNLAANVFYMGRRQA